MSFLSNRNLQNRIITFRKTSFSEICRNKVTAYKTASMPVGRSRRKQASVQTELMTIEVRTSSGAEMRLTGNFSAEMLRTILGNV